MNRKTKSALSYTGVSWSNKQIHDSPKSRKEKKADRKKIQEEKNAFYKKELLSSKNKITHYLKIFLIYSDNEHNFDESYLEKIHALSLDKKIELSIWLNTRNNRIKLNALKKLYGFIDKRHDY